MPISDMIVVWRIACGDTWVDVQETGTVTGPDEALCERLRKHLEEPVDVSNTGSGGVPMVLQPTDRRYVVARIRKLVAEAEDLQVVDLYFTGEPPGPPQSTA